MHKMKFEHMQRVKELELKIEENELIRSAEEEIAAAKFKPVNIEGSDDVSVKSESVDPQLIAKRTKEWVEQSQTIASPSVNALDDLFHTTPASDQDNQSVHQSNSVKVTSQASRHQTASHQLQSENHPEIKQMLEEMKSTFSAMQKLVLDNQPKVQASPSSQIDQPQQLPASNPTSNLCASASPWIQVAKTLHTIHQMLSIQP